MTPTAKKDWTIVRGNLYLCLLSIVHQKVKFTSVIYVWLCHNFSFSLLLSAFVLRQFYMNSAASVNAKFILRLI